MRARRRLRRLVPLVVALAAGAAAARGQDFRVERTSPAAGALAAPVDTEITVRFTSPVHGASVTADTFWAFGRWSGPVTGVILESFDGLSVTLVPDRRFSAGELVTVFLSDRVTGGAAMAPLAGGHSFQFWTRSRGAGLDLAEIGRLSTRTSPGVSTRAYGGFGSDLDGDGFLDLTIVNEDTNDLRTFLNRGDRSGRLGDMLRPPARVGAVPSPSEPSDFDRDGRVDVAVANTRGDTVSILLGNGDGTFAPATHHHVGGEPRGLAVLDADGDGDVDVAATSFTDGRVTVLLNDGTGGFGEIRSFGTGGGERALAAGDMNGDGALDLVVGDPVAGEIRVYAAAGGGAFELVGREASGGEVWMLVLGDVDGDGDEDVAAVNSRSDNAAILLGDGAGGLAPPRLVATDGFPLATDLADLDGDGDLDWVTSSFFGDWQLFENIGGGVFRLAASFDAPQAASCSLPMDLDNDGVLDLVLIDELEDEIVLLGARATVFASSFESGGIGDWSRSRGAPAVVAPGLRGSGHALEVRVDGGRVWVESRQPAREPSLVVELLIDPSPLELGAGAALEILRLGGGRGEARLLLERAAGSALRYRARLLARVGGAFPERAVFRDVGTVALRADRPTRLGVQWAASTARPETRAAGRGAADGWAALTRNGRLLAVADDLDNPGRRVGRLRLGLPTAARGPVGGSLLVDEVVIRR